MLRFTTAALLAVATIAAGCERPSDRQPDPGGDVAAAERLPDHVLAELKARTPELAEAPQPEPSPSPNASPSDIPPRLAGTLDGEVLERVTGPATFYADKFEGRRTASGIPFRQNQMVAAHRGYPFGTILRVTNLRNDRSVKVRVVDRGPFARPRGAERPVLDVSTRAARQLDFIDAGRAQVRIEVLEWGQGVTSS